jgi:hypothetical protein
MHTDGDVRPRHARLHEQLEDPLAGIPIAMRTRSLTNPINPSWAEQRARQLAQPAPFSALARTNALAGGKQTWNSYRGSRANAFVNTMEALRSNFETTVYLELASNPFAADVTVPATFRAAIDGLHSEQWLKAVRSEVESLAKLGVFRVIKRSAMPANANEISARWVFKVKPSADGSVERFKARLCARGFLQKEGIDYSATFSPVASPATIKLLLAIAAQRRLDLRSADVSTAFLHGVLPPEERVYMTPPSGIDTVNDEVLELHRCIYGLKQASRRWFERLQSVLRKGGYEPTEADPCLYARNIEGEHTMITCVVDDLLIASTTKVGSKRVVEIMRRAGLQTKDLGFPDYVIGIHIAKDTQGNIFLNQQLYLDTVLRRFDMEKCHPVSTPADSNVKLSTQFCPSTHKEELDMSTKPYRSLVGALLYLVLTRPDISVAVNELCRYMANPGQTMWTAAKRVLRYLRGTRNYHIKLPRKATNPMGQELWGYVDASHGDDRDTRRSRCGYLLYFNDSLISWKTTMQKRVSMSTAEAEYRAATIATKEVVWLRRLLAEIGVQQSAPTVLYEDNAACTKMISNPMVSGRNKHVELDMHFVRDHFKLGSVTPVPISTYDQRADLMTKNLPRPAFERHTKAILCKKMNVLCV